MNWFVVLEDSDHKYNDLQLSCKQLLPLDSGDTFLRISHVNYQKTPLYLLQSGAVDVYTTIPETQEYIRQNLVNFAATNPQIGLLFRSSSNTNLFVVLILVEHKVKALLLDFLNFEKVSQYEDKDSSANIIIDIRTHTYNIHAIDKVLEKKKRSKSTTPLAQSSGSSQEQINTTVSKVVLSGLRLRGLSATLATNSKEKIRIKEIYHMTYKAALFAIRKYGNTPKLNDVQEIVEKLLQIFIDVNESDNPFVD